MSSKPAAVFRRAREIREGWRSTGQACRRLAILASFVVEPLEPYLIVAADEADCPIEPWIAPFGLFEQRVLARRSDLWDPAPAALWIAMRLEDVTPELPFRLVEEGHSAVAAGLDDLRTRLTLLAGAARASFQAPILVSNLWAPHDLGGALFDASDPDGLTHLLAAANRQLARDLAAIDDCHVFDEARCVAEAGRHRWSDRRLRHLARISPGADAQPQYADSIVRSVART